MIALAMLAAVVLDLILGEPRRWHPLVAFGRLAGYCEQRLYGDARWSGLVAWAISVLPVVLIMAVAHAALLRWSLWASGVFNAVMLYLAIGLRSLEEHARPVAEALLQNDLPAARTAVSRMVSRDTGALDESRVAAAATESVLENGADAVFGALFWFALLGAPGVVLYRLANTLDAMWGYRTPRYERFGWAAARIDDVLNYVPARLTAVTYALSGDASRAWRCWRRQARAWDSPNAGPVMAAGAGAIAVRLGGPAPYHGVMEERPRLGEGETASAMSIKAAVMLVKRGVALWVMMALLWMFASLGGTHA
ncbi:adenosylcobinamide-phosphate synthase CbiB [Dyella sp.]|uniref:adenosylcobinamide-phosphate synthase CbiB n=1 Tax=Dyella sp. TaxID=1869338 RepID=UPI002ED25AF3